MEIRRVPRLRWGNPQITDKARFNIEEAGFVRGEPTDDGSRSMRLQGCWGRGNRIHLWKREKF